MPVKPYLQPLRRLTLTAATALGLTWAPSTMAQAVERAHHANPPLHPAAAILSHIEPSHAPGTLAYESVFTRYRSFRDQPLSDWAGTNRTVNNLGGWRAYAREAQRDSAADKSSGAHQQHGGKP